MPLANNPIFRYNFYAALFYVWENPAVTEDIELDGIRMPGSLFPEANVVLAWADAQNPGIQTIQLLHEEFSNISDENLEILS